MKLNPYKSDGEIPWLYASFRRIKANPKKVKAILEMSLPKLTKEVLRLTERIGALNCFISKLANKCLPFFKLCRAATRYK